MLARWSGNGLHSFLFDICFDIIFVFIHRRLFQMLNQPTRMKHAHYASSECESGPDAIPGKSQTSQSIYCTPREYVSPDVCQRDDTRQLQCIKSIKCYGSEQETRASSDEQRVTIRTWISGWDVR